MPKSKVIEIGEVKGGYMRVRLAPEERFASKPGQFVMVRVGEGTDPLLRRPFGLHRVDPEGRWFELLFRVAGKGTKMLAQKRLGDQLDVLAPLGNGFGQGGEIPLIVGGGIGVAPLLYLAEDMLSRGLRPTMFLGGRSDRDVLCHDEFSCLAVPIQCATEDGTLGETGLVTKLLADYLSSHTQDMAKISVHACGPTPMLAAVARLCEGYGVYCEVSLESHMACGVGACLGCVVKSLEEKNMRVCKEGPVFDSRIINWP